MQHKLWSIIKFCWKSVVDFLSQVITIPHPKFYSSVILRKTKRLTLLVFSCESNVVDNFALTTASSIFSRVIIKPPCGMEMIIFFVIMVQLGSTFFFPFFWWAYYWMVTSVSLLLSSHVFNKPNIGIPNRWIKHKVAIRCPTCPTNVIKTFFFLMAFILSKNFISKSERIFASLL